MIDNPALQGSITGLTPQQFIAGLIRVMITGLLILSVLFFFFKLVTGGMAWINSSGEKVKLEQARGQILNAIIGLVVVFSSFAIVKLVESVFGVNITSFDLSTLQI